MKKTLNLAFMLCAVFAVSLFAQPRPADKTSSTPKPNPAPESFEAKYQGGIFGFADKMNGKLKFDDVNERLVFFNKDGKEQFSIPYKSMLVVYPQSQSVTSNAGRVISVIPLPGAGLAGFMREKRRYLVVNYDDPDVDVKGLVSFKLADKELLDSVVRTLGEKAKLTQRGDAFFRPRPNTQSL